VEERVPYSRVGDWFAGLGPAGPLCSLLMWIRGSSQRVSGSSGWMTGNGGGDEVVVTEASCGRLSPAGELSASERLTHSEHKSRRARSRSNRVRGIAGGR
jgi:hypothetical protein